MTTSLAIKRFSTKLLSKLKRWSKRQDSSFNWSLMRVSLVLQSRCSEETIINLWPSFRRRRSTKKSTSRSSCCALQRLINWVMTTRSIVALHSQSTLSKPPRRTSTNGKQIGSTSVNMPIMTSLSMRTYNLINSPPVWTQNSMASLTHMKFV